MANVDTDKMRMYVPNPSTGQMEPTGDLIRLMDHRLGEPNVSNDIGKVPAYVGSHFFEWQKRAIIATGTATAETSGTAAQNGYGRLDIPSSVLQHEGWLQIRYSYTPSQSFYFAFSGENGYSPLRYHGTILTADDAGIIRSGDLVTVFAEQVTIGNTTGFYFHLIGVDRKERCDEMLGDGAFYPNAVQDFDGNWYNAVIIGNQVWLAENLRTTHYSDGTAIAHGGTNYSESTPYYYHVNGDNGNDGSLGLLYNQPAVMNGGSMTDAIPSGVQGIAPAGWHIPSKTEWNKLYSYIGKQNRLLADETTPSYVAKALAAVSGWNSSNVDYSVGKNPELNNKTGFNAKPSGSMSVSASNTVVYDGTGYAQFASASKYTNTSMAIQMLQPQRADTYTFGRDFSFSHHVRCVCDMTPFQFREWYVRKYGSIQHHISQEQGFIYLYENTKISNRMAANTVVDIPLKFGKIDQLILMYFSHNVNAGDVLSIATFDTPVKYPIFRAGIYYKGASITTGVIKAGDHAIMIYNSDNNRFLVTHVSKDRSFEENWQTIVMQNGDTSVNIVPQEKYASTFIDNTNNDSEVGIVIDQTGVDSMLEEYDSPSVPANAIARIETKRFSSGALVYLSVKINLIDKPYYSVDWFTAETNFEGMMHKAYNDYGWNLNQYLTNLDDTTIGSFKPDKMVRTGTLTIDGVVYNRYQQYFWDSGSYHTYDNIYDNIELLIPVSFPFYEKNAVKKTGRMPSAYIKRIVLITDKTFGNTITEYTATSVDDLSKPLTLIDFDI